jgi:HEAT repeat protein
MRFCIAGTMTLSLLAGCGQQQPSPAAKPVQQWVKTLQDGDARVRRTAVRKLGMVAREEPEVVRVLVRTLKDPNPPVRCEALLALAKAGPEAKQAISPISELQQDPDQNVRLYAGRALEKLRGRE